MAATNYSTQHNIPLSRPHVHSHLNSNNAHLFHIRPSTEILFLLPLPSCLYTEWLWPWYWFLFWICLHPVFNKYAKLQLDLPPDSDIFYNWSIQIHTFEHTFFLCNYLKHLTSLLPDLQLWLHWNVCSSLSEYKWSWTLIGWGCLWSLHYMFILDNARLAVRPSSNQIYLWFWRTVFSEKLTPQDNNVPTSGVYAVNIFD